MSISTSYLAGVAFLPEWLNPCPDRVSADRRLAEWCRSTNWPRVGLSWPHWIVSATATELTEVDAVPAGAATAPLNSPGRNPGVVWADSRPGESWTAEDAAHLTLAARLIERSPALDAWLGPIPDPDALATRLADAAVIAGRMAHDFDNILTGVIGFTDLSLPYAEPGSPLESYLQGAADAGQRGMLFTQQLHEFNRCAQVRPQPGSVAACLEGLRGRLAAAAPKVVVAIDLPADLPPVAVESGPLGVVLGHLLRNAAEAQPAGGAVTIRAAAEELSAAGCGRYLGALTPGPHVVVEVRDDGPGVKPEAWAKLFRDPFYTTKVRHRGLGLATVYRCARAHGGGVRVEPPAAGSGACVRLALPASRVPSPAPLHSTPAPAAAPRASTQAPRKVTP